MNSLWRVVVDRNISTVRYIDQWLHYSTFRCRWVFADTTLQHVQNVLTDLSCVERTWGVGRTPQRSSAFPASTIRRVSCSGCPLPPLGQRGCPFGSTFPSVTISVAEPQPPILGIVLVFFMKINMIHWSFFIFIIDFCSVQKDKF